MCKLRVLAGFQKHMLLLDMMSVTPEGIGMQAWVLRDCFGKTRMELSVRARL